MSWQPGPYQQQRVTYCLRRTEDGAWWSKRYGWSTNPLLRREFDALELMPATMDGRERNILCGQAVYYTGCGSTIKVYAESEQARGTRE